MNYRHFVQVFSHTSLSFVVLDYYNQGNNSWVGIRKQIHRQLSLPSGTPTVVSISSALSPIFLSFKTWQPYISRIAILSYCYDCAKQMIISQLQHSVHPLKTCLLQYRLYCSKATLKQNWWGPSICVQTFSKYLFVGFWYSSKVGAFVFFFSRLALSHASFRSRLGSKSTVYLDATNLKGNTPWGRE